ncbi:MAG: hypothetical protein IKE53_07100 [Clostridiales bacterium]|nr:hypothetical protein [Clostridiales bacterium]
MVYYAKGSDLMGIMMIALERLTVSPEPTMELMKDFWLFSEYFCPPDYHEQNVGLNPWFFDKDNKLVSAGGKMCEPKVWYKHIKAFLEKRGFQLLGDPKLVYETDVDIDVRQLELERLIERFDNRKILEQRFLSEEIQVNDEFDKEE